MALKAKTALGTDQLTALADRGYYNAQQILACEQSGIIPLVLKPLTSNSKAQGRFGQRDFIYETPLVPSCCPAGEHATHRFTSE